MSHAVTLVTDERNRGPCSMPVFMAVALDHAGSTSAASPGDPSGVAGRHLHETPGRGGIAGVAADSCRISISRGMANTHMVVGFCSGRRH